MSDRSSSGRRREQTPPAHARAGRGSEDSECSRKSLTYQLPKLPQYDGVDKDGHIDNWLNSVEEAADASGWSDKELCHVVKALISTKILEHLNNHPRMERETYEQMRQILLKRYGSKRTAQSVRDQFRHSRQEANETSEDFLDRLLRDYAIGFAHEQNHRIRHHDVLTVFMHGLSDSKLSESLEAEYMKPCYADEPPTPADLRFYLNRLESFAV